MAVARGRTGVTGALPPENVVGSRAEALVGEGRLPQDELPKDPPVRCASAGDTSTNRSRRMIAAKTATARRLVILMGPRFA